MQHRNSAWAAFILLVVSASNLARCEEAKSPRVIKQLDLIHFSHTDYGFTDHPAVCRDLQRRYLDIALDAAQATRDAPETSKFRWTAETTVAVLDWWQAASESRRAMFLDAVRAGQIEVSALPLNNTPFLDRRQWQTMTHWLPEDLWQKLQPRAAVQNDVNGFPRAGAMALLDRNIRFLFSGINGDSGGAPFDRPSAFWWKMPDGRKMFVWLSLTYGEGFFFFETTEWRRGPLPLAADARYRPPRSGDILRCDEASLRAAHAQCMNRIAQLESGGYQYPVLAVSMTNMWRYDNDPPFPPLSDFIAAWNKLKLQPELRLVTIGQAMEDLERVAGPKAPVREGEWTDWWANGTASAPREVAASRFAKRYLNAAQSPVWGPLDDASRGRIVELTKDLCLFDEHTWGSGLSVAQPYGLDSQGQFNEKARYAWRPMALSEWLLGQRARTKLVRESEGLYVANPTSSTFTGWANLISSALRDDYKSVVNTENGAKIPLDFQPGMQPFERPASPADLSREDVSRTFADHAANRYARFWVDRLAPDSIRKYQLVKDSVADQPSTGPQPTIETDEQGWPVAATWPGMSKPLFARGTGDFIAVRADAFAPRWAMRDVWDHPRDEKREAMRQGILKNVAAEPEDKATRTETPHTLVFRQPVKHPRLAWATRQLELWKDEPRARLTFRFNRTTSFDPEIFYIETAMPCDGILPRAGCGGQTFVPFRDQLSGTCRDYFGIDGWMRYEAPEGNWLWVTRDAPLVTIDGPHPLGKITEQPKRTARVLSMVYNNFWYTNFVGDSPGVMEFQYDLTWQSKIKDDAAAEATAETLVSEPVMSINPAMPESPIFIQDLYRP